jgi:prevent-host-death family protein
LTATADIGNFDWSIRLVEMRTIQASLAKTHLPQLLDEVERGETIVITRHGRPIARLVPELERDDSKIEAAIEGLESLRRRVGSLSAEEIVALLHEGHRY